MEVLRGMLIIKLGTELITLLALFAMALCIIHRSIQKLEDGQSGMEMPQANSSMIQIHPISLDARLREHWEYTCEQKTSRSSSLKIKSWHTSRLLNENSDSVLMSRLMWL